MNRALLLTLLSGTPFAEVFEVEDRSALIESADQVMIERLAASAWASLDALGLEGEVTHRIKSPDSVLAKMVRKGVGPESIHDRLAVRVRVDEPDDCYRVLDALHARHPLVEGEFDDYIRDPKPSGYQSLHTAVKLVAPHGGVQTAEFQIRTHAMHAFAETGPAAHHLYKAGAFEA